MNYTCNPCHCVIEILGSEYHYNTTSAIPNTQIRVYLHFSQKLLSIILIFVYAFYFWRKRKLKGLEGMLNETVFHYLDSIMDELFEEITESTSLNYHQALKIHKQKQTYIEERSEFLTKNNNSSSKSLFLRDNSNLNLNNKTKEIPMRSKTNYSLYGLENLKHKPSATAEFISKNNEEIEVFYEDNSVNSGDSNCFISNNDFFAELSNSGVFKTNKHSENGYHISKRSTPPSMALNPSLDIYRNFYICDCYECCCECCCSLWMQTIFNPILKIYLRLKQRILRFIVKNIKKLCFYFILLGCFFEMALRNAVAILLSDCLQSRLGDNFKIIFGIFIFIDFIVCSSFFFCLVFMISFLSTRKEFLAVNPSNKKVRGRIIFYHLNKGMIYGVFHLIFQICFRIVFLFKRPFYEIDEGSDTSLFYLLKYAFVFSFITHNYHNWKSNILIQEDCDILKFQNRYYAIQNTFLKFLPNHYNMLKFFKFYIRGRNKSSSIINVNSESPMSQTLSNKEINASVNKNFEKKDLFKKIKNDLEVNMSYVKMQLEEQLNIVEKQKFKRILRNRGLYPMIQLCSLYLILIISCIYMIVSGACLVKVNTAYDYNETVYSLLFVAIFIMNLMEFTVIPLMVKFTLKRVYYLDFEQQPQQPFSIYEEEDK